jgi:hypothetical protein
MRIFGRPKLAAAVKPLTAALIKDTIRRHDVAGVQGVGQTSGETYRH